MANTTVVTKLTFDMMHDKDQALLLEELNSEEVGRLIPAIAFLLITCVIGIIGNGIVIHVYRIKYKTSNTKCFILCLSAVDLMTCCIAIPLDVLTILEEFTLKHIWLCKMSRLFNTLGTISSGFILVFIALDRYRKVCKPFNWQIEIRVAKCLCGFAVFLGVMIAWPAIFLYGKKTFHIPEYNVTGAECSTADDFVKTYSFVYSMVFGVLFVGGLVAMSVIYCFIGFKVRRQTLKMKELRCRKSFVPITSSGSEERHSKFENDLQNQSKSGMAFKQKRKENRMLEVSNADSVERAEQGNRQDILNDRDGVDRDIRMQNISTRVNVEQKKMKSQTPDIYVKPDMYLQRRSTKELTDTVSSTSSCRIFQFPNRIIRRLSAISNQISGIFPRMASSKSANVEHDIGTARKSQFSKHTQAKRTALIMFIITVGFVLSFLPHVVLMLARQINSEFVTNMSETDTTIYKFSLRSYFLNCAINPILYSIFDSTFKLSCKQVFGHSCR